MATIADLLVKIGVDADDIEAGVEGAAEVVDRNFAKISAAGVAGGAALEGFARSQQDTNAALERVAMNSDASADSLRDSAAEMANHTFSAHDAVAGMERLTKSGITQQDQFEKLLPTFDDLADATGRSLVDGIDNAERLLGPFGEGIEDVGDNVDQMARLIAQTEVPIGSLERNLARVPNELQALGFGLDDAAAGVQVFMDKGFESKEAVREFRRAVEDSEGDMGEFLDLLGLSADEWDSYTAAAEPAPGLASDIAGANNDQMTAMERLQQNVENLTFRYGFLAETASSLALPMMALGPASKVVSKGMKGSIAAGKGAGKALRLAGRGAGKAVGAFGRLGSAALTAAGQVVSAGARMAASAAKTAAKVVGQIAIQVAKWVVLGVQSLLHAAKVALAWMISLGPIALVIAAVVGLVALIIANWGKITAAISAGWRFVKRITSTVWNAIVDFFTEIPGRIIGAVTALVGMYVGFWRKVLTTGFNVIKTVVTSVVDFYRRLPGRILDAISSLASKIAGFFRRVMTGARNAVVDRFNAIRNFFSGIPGKILRALGNLGRLLVDAGRSIMDGLLQGLKDSFGKVTDFAGSIGGKIKDLKGPLPEDARLLIPEGSAIIEGLGAGMDDEMARLERQVVAFAERLTESAAIDPLAVNDFDTPWVPGMAQVGGEGGGDTVNIYPQGSILAERDIVEIVRNERNRGGFRGSFR